MGGTDHREIYTTLQGDKCNEGWGWGAEGTEGPE